MQLLKTGELFDKNKTKYPEGCKFDITDSGANLYIFFKNPSVGEIENCKKGTITFRFIKLDNIIFFLTKIGSIPTLDCPYSIHLSQNLTGIQYPEGNQWLSLRLCLINAANGILEATRLISFNEKFSRELINTIQEQGNEKFDERKYDIDLDNIYRKYSTKQLENMSRYYYKTREE